MSNGRINTKGRLERGRAKTNRNMLSYENAVQILNDIYGRNYDSWKDVKPPSPPKVIEVPNWHQVDSIDELIPIKRFVGKTVSLFKGRSYKFMAENYPHVMRTFINQHRDIQFSKPVFNELMSIIKCQINMREAK